VLAQMHLFENKFAELPTSEKAAAITVQVLPKHLDEEVARYMVQGFGGVITQLTPAQAKYINVPVEGPFKPESYKY
jgi:adenosylhomocysteinase